MVLASGECVCASAWLVTHGASFTPAPLTRPDGWVHAGCWLQPHAHGPHFMPIRAVLYHCPLPASGGMHSLTLLMSPVFHIFFRSLCHRIYNGRVQVAHALWAVLVVSGIGRYIGQGIGQGIGEVRLAWFLAGGQHPVCCFVSLNSCVCNKNFVVLFGIVLFAALPQWLGKGLHFGRRPPPGARSP